MDRLEPRSRTRRPGYTLGMKTAISIPDDLFASADAFAARSQLSRSELFARAIREYLQRYDQDQITRELDDLVEQLDTRLEPDLAGASRRALERSEW